jgi:hypothetical protein
MNIKAIIAAGITAAGLLVAAPAAEAKTHIILNVGPGYGPGPGDCHWYHGQYRCFGPHFYQGGLPLWDSDPFAGDNGYDQGYDSGYDNGRLDCGEARFMLRERGFRNLKSLDCSGKSLLFRATKSGIAYRVRVNAFTGNFTANAY